MTMETLIGGLSATQSWPPSGHGAAWGAARSMGVQHGRQGRATRRFAPKTGAGVNQMDNKKLRGAVARKAALASKAARAGSSASQTDLDRVKTEAPLDKARGPYLATAGAEAAKTVKATKASLATPLTLAAESPRVVSAVQSPALFVLDTLAYTPDMSLAPVPAPAQDKPARAAPVGKDHPAREFTEKLGRVCDATYEGVNSVASRLMHTYKDLRRGIVSAIHEAVTWAATGPTSDPTVRAADLTFPMDSVLKATEVMDKFKGDAITPENMHYLTVGTSIRRRMDEEGHGMGAAPTNESSSVARRLATGTISLENPWRGFPNWEASRRNREESQVYNEYLDRTYGRSELDSVSKRIWVYAAQDGKATPEWVRTRGSEDIQQFAQDIAWMRTCMADMANKLREISASR
jgi:hypothetical protein